MTTKTTNKTCPGASDAPAAFEGFSTETLAFFAALKFNNNRAFFEEMRPVYERAVKAPLYALAERLAPVALAIDPAFDPRPSRAVSRIWRDVRFRRDKSPLRCNMWVGFHRLDEERGDSCGFYFDISADSADWGCGFYRMQPETMANLRRVLTEKPERVRRVLRAPAFDGRFAVLGESYQRQYRPPEGMEPALGALYQKKSVYCEHSVENLDEVMRPELADTVAEDFKALAPFYGLLRACADGTL